MSVKINKNGKEYPVGVIPKNYPADRVYLDGDLSKTVQDMIKTVTGTMSSTSDTYVYVPFPTGWDASNSVIIGYTALNSSNSIWYTNYSAITVLAEDAGGIRIKTTDTNFLGQPFKITLYRI